MRSSDKEGCKKMGRGGNRDADEKKRRVGEELRDAGERRGLRVAEREGVN